MAKARVAKAILHAVQRLSKGGGVKARLARAGNKTLGKRNTAIRAWSQASTVGAVKGTDRTIMHHSRRLRKIGDLEHKVGQARKVTRKKVGVGAAVAGVGAAAGYGAHRALRKKKKR